MKYTFTLTLASLLAFSLLAIGCKDSHTHTEGDGHTHTQGDDHKHSPNDGHKH